MWLQRIRFFENVDVGIEVVENETLLNVLAENKVLWDEIFGNVVVGVISGRAIPC